MFETAASAARDVARALRHPVGAVVASLVSGVLLAAQPCFDCHETASGVPEQGVHAVLDCVDCHTGAEEMPHAEGVAQVACATCHAEAAEEYARSNHGRGRERGEADAPACASCHGPVHAIVPASSSDSPVNPSRVAETCGACHSDPALAAKYGIPVSQPVEAYGKSVHARARDAGREAATCGDCHGNHLVLGANDPQSSVNHQRVPETCGACHAEIAGAYAGSVHGRAAAHGVREAPVCTDCHGEHRILAPLERGSPVFASNIPKMTCGRCHGDLRVAEKFGLDPERVSAYSDSYHGLAMRSGATTVAHCGSCHGVHDVLPSSDPRSLTHRDNLPRTCGQCHPGAGESFAIGAVHVLPTERKHAAVYWVRSAYLWLIVVTVGGMLLHNGADFWRKLRQPPHRPAPRDVRSPVRMDRSSRRAHAILLVSFAVLVYTGFALTYPEAWWARPLLQWESRLGLRGGLHRTAALALLAALAFHLVHLVVDRRARACIAMMRPTREDWSEFKERLAYFAGRCPEPPRSSWLSYPEKLEYLALMWGIVVMAGTGFVLWFQDWALRLMPTWMIDVATVIHFYEAVLATLAILVWHLYFVVFDPLVYPLDTAWLTGRAAAGRAHERDSFGAQLRRRAGRPFRQRTAAKARRTGRRDSGDPSRG